MKKFSSEFAHSYKSYFSGKKITVMGLGLLGRGVGDAEFLASCGAELIVTDLKKEDALASSLARLKNFSNIRYTLGKHTLEDFKNRDFILKAAGVSSDSPFIKEARRQGIPVKMSASWFTEISGIPIIGVTGTRGKTTTMYLVYEILEASGRQVLLGGNIKGISTLALLPKVKKESIGLFELDSWQCRGFGEEEMSPSLSVFTSFFPDHLDYYPDMNSYLEDKAQIFLHQEPPDTLIIGEQAESVILEKYGERIKSDIIVADPARFPRGWRLNLLGEHNVSNAMCALEAARVLGVNDSISQKIFREFKGPSGRLELIKEIRGIKIYNDTTATTPDATMAALKALDTGMRTVILIIGGTDKNLPLEALTKEVQRRVKKVILLKGSGTERLKDLFSSLPVHSSLEDAFHDAYEGAEEGDVILFSPAFSSHEMFANEYDRGEKFNVLVNKI